MPYCMGFRVQGLLCYIIIYGSGFRVYYALLYRVLGLRCIILLLYRV